MQNSPVYMLLRVTTTEEINSIQRKLLMVMSISMRITERLHIERTVTGAYMPRMKDAAI